MIREGNFLQTVKIRIDQAEAGMVVASDVYNMNNQLIVSKGSILTERAITRLRYYNIYGLEIYASQENKERQVKEGSYIEALRSSTDFKKFNRTYVDTVSQVENCFNKVITGAEFDPEKLLEETDRIIRECRNGAHILEMLHGIRDYDDITFVHSLNVALICNIFAGWLRLSPEETKVLTLAGLLHDIGKMLVPKEIITKADKLTEEEYKIIKKHTVKGYQILRDQAIDDRVKLAALLHHERCDGSGYPNRFTREQIDNFAKIVAIVDVYDAMTSNRRYRSAICPFDVVDNFEREGLLKYDPKYLLTFLENIVMSYLHNTVRLSDGREGEVIMINKLALSRPVVRIGDGFVDLSKEPELVIEEIV